MKRAFTFIETVVVLGVVSITLPVLFAIIITIFQQETRIYALKDIKQQGDSVLQNIKFTVQQKGAQVVDDNYQYDVCPLLTSPTPTYTPQMYLIDADENTFTYFVDSNKVASESSVGTRSYLTNSRVTISNLGFSCYKTNSFSPPIIVTSFDVTHSILPITLPYYSTFKLRSY